MCYTRDDRSFEEQVRRTMAEDERRRRLEAETKTPESGRQDEDKPLTERLRELVGASK